MNQDWRSLGDALPPPPNKDCWVMYPPPNIKLDQDQPVMPL